jgi:ABC-type Fe3+-hydroxamate transport system substrate-binding protein
MLYTDQLGNGVWLPAPPRRVVSVVPSQTELLFDLGLSEYVVGITKFCTRPAAWRQEKKRVGGTKNLDLAAIEALAPDLIIANKEENTKSEIEALRQKYPVWLSDIYDLPDALTMIKSVGSLWQSQDIKQRASALADDIGRNFAAIAQNEKKPLRAAYFIWREPFMVAASETFITDMMQRAGFRNAFGALSRYPVLSAEEIQKADLDVILLSSEPYPFAAKHVAEFAELCPNTPIEIVDGELFSWYGSRLQYSPAYFADLYARVATQTKRAE